VASQELDQLLEQIRALFVDEYHRGEQDAIARIVKAAQGAPIAAVPASPKPNGAGHARSKSRKEPVPKGTAKELIDRVLKDRSSRGASPTEIKAAAASDSERSISHSGLRFALTMGRDEQRYENRGGKWFLVAQRPAADTEMPRGDSR
jgi:hypothetical protein